ncbi:MAG: amidohydrolase family protein [Gemmatirosa sp.]
MPRRLLFAPLALPVIVAARQPPGAAPVAQLLITRARVLDVRTGRVAIGCTVVVDGGRIARVTTDAAARAAGERARDTLDARGRLLTPAFVDAHFHSGIVLGDSITAGGGYLTRLSGHPVSGHPDSVRAYRRRVAAAYLPHGVALVRDVGSAPRDHAMLRAWMARSAHAPDLLVSGAQLVSPESGRTPPPFQVPVADSAAAAAQVRAYAAAGFGHVKLYWRLREPALVGALAEARRLGMTATAHVDQGIVTHDRALVLGVRHFEHVHPIAASVLRPEERREAAERAAALLGGPAARALAKPGAFFQYVPEQWRLLGPGDARVLALIERLRATHSTLTPTLHVLAQRAGVAPFASPPAGPFEDVRAFTPAQRARSAEGYRVMAGYVARMDARGVRLAIGTDTQEPGRAVLSEMTLLHAAGIPMWRVLRIATLQSAEAVGRGADYGTVEPGRRASVVLFDADPLVTPRALFGAKTVVKDGVVWRAGAR